MAKGFPLDRNGVPICSREDIEQKAEDVINYISPSTLIRPGFTPLALITTELNKQFGVLFDFDQDLGLTSTGNKILGKFLTKPRAIFVDRSLDFNEPRWAFTLAHELGHFVLHRRVTIELGEEHYATFSDTVYQFKAALLEQSAWTPCQWLEWQANAFAASLLMPRTTFRTAFMNAMSSQEHSRGKPYIYLDNQPDSARLLQSIKGDLTGTFQVSSTAVERRLNDLQMLIDARPRATKHIIEFLREE